MRIAFRVMVDSGRSVSALPGLLKLLDEYKIQTSFAFSLGSEGRGGSRGLLGKLFGGNASDDLIGKAHDATLLSVKEAGHELGIAPSIPQLWRSEAGVNETDEWTLRQFRDALDRFVDLFKAQPVFHAATDWQINPALLAIEEAHGLKFASDVRGKSIFYPKLQETLSHSPQIPTTLPTFEEIARRPEVTAEKIHEFLFAESQRILPHGEVFSINPESLDLQLFEKMVVMWKSTQWKFMRMGDLLDSNEKALIGYHQVGWGKVADNALDMVIQSLPLTDK